MINWQQLVVGPCVGAFGQSYSITWNGQTFSGLTGVYDEAYRETDVSDGMPVTTTRPCLGVNTADVNLGALPLSELQGARLTVYASPLPGGAPPVDTDFIVQQARADGHGWALLMLNEAPTLADEPAGGGQDA